MLKTHRRMAKVPDSSGGLGPNPNPNPNPNPTQAASSSRRAYAPAGHISTVDCRCTSSPRDEGGDNQPPYLLAMAFVLVLVMELARSCAPPLTFVMCPCSLTVIII
eukprot:scaffold33941_cov42-Phaeocystis_antarctica.AAC.3